MSRRVFGRLADTCSDLGLRLPWWLALGLAAATYFLLDWYAGKSGGHQLASIGSYLLPALIILLAAYSAYRRRKRKNLLTDAARGKEGFLRRLSSGDFFFLVSAYFGERGFEVEEHDAPDSCDGSAFIAAKQHERYLVTCLHGSSPNLSKAAIEKVGDLVGELGITGGVIVTGAAIPEEVKQAARGKKVDLLDGRELHGRIRSQIESMGSEARAAGSRTKVFRLLTLIGVAVALAVAGIVYTDHGRRLYDRAVKEIDSYVDLEGVQYWIESARRAVFGERELVFTEEQIEEAMREVLLEKQTAPVETAEEAQNAPRYRYEIELHSGGWISADNVEIEETTITYRSRKGLEISLDRDEVKTLKRIRVN